jgi:hypothetical protein
MKLYFCLKAAKDFIIKQGKENYSKEDIKRFFDRSSPKNFGMRQP